MWTKIQTLSKSEDLIKSLSKPRLLRTTYLALSDCMSGKPFFRRAFSFLKGGTFQLMRALLESLKSDKIDKCLFDILPNHNHLNDMIHHIIEQYTENIHCR